MVAPIKEGPAHGPAAQRLPHGAARGPRASEQLASWPSVTHIHGSIV